MSGRSWRIIALSLVALFMYAAGGYGGHNTPGRNDDNYRSGERGTTMNARYVQPYANPQLNSCQPLAVRASGKQGWRFVYNKECFMGNARFVHAIDDKRAVIDYGGVFFALDLLRRSTISGPLKSDNTFIRLGEGQLFYLFSGWELVPLEFDRIISDRLGQVEEETEGENEREEPGEEQSDSLPRAHYYVPGLGPYSFLACLYPDTASFIVGIQATGNPRFPNQSFALLEMPYGGQKEKWSWGFDGTAVVPSISAHGETVVARKDLLTIVDRNGVVSAEVKGEFEPISCSIGPDNLIYLVCTTGAGPRLRVYDFSGKLVREIKGVTAEPIQPPIVGIDSIVYLIDGSKVEAFREGKKLWVYPLTSEAPAATVSGDGKLLIADGVRIICLDASGREVWSYKDKKGELYVTPPVIDGAGNVLVASDNVIIMIK